MSKVLSLIFTEDFFAATVLKSGEVSLLEVDGFQLLPLFYEVKNDSIVYPLGKEEFASAQGRTTFGDYFQLIDGNTTFSLFGTHYALVTIITHVLDRIKDKYRQATENQAEQITTILTLPTNASGRAKDRLKDFLGKRGFKIVQEISLAQAIKLNYSRLSKIGILDSLGKGRIEFEVLSESDQYNENIYDFYEEKSREQLTKMVFEKALQSSFSSLVNDEVGKSVEYKQYIYLAKEWLTKLKLKAEIDIHFTFSDGYTGSTTLTRAAADELMIDATLILNKIRTLQDKVKVSAPLQGIFLLGEKLDNTALFTSLQQVFSTDKIFSLANDVKAVKEISAGVLLANQKQFQDDASIQLQKLITDMANTQKGISESDKVEIIKIANQASISEAQVNEWIGKETQKVKVVKLLGLEQVTQLEEIQDHKYGRAVRKIMKEQYASDKYERTKFYNEAKVLAQLSHPHIGKILDLSEENDPKLHYIAQYIGGKMLASLMPVANVATIQRYALQLLDALQYLHARNIWYKTLKPKNIIVNPNTDEFKLVTSGLEVTDNISQRQRQNIKDFGLILLEMFTGKTAYQAISAVSDEKWADIIKKTSTGSSGDPYKNVQEIIRDIEKKGAGDGSSFNFPIKKIFTWFTVFAILSLSIVFLKDSVKSLISRIGSKATEESVEVLNADAFPNIQARFGGKLRLPSKKKADFWLTIKNLKPLQGSKAVFVYAIRLDSLNGDYRYYNDREQVGELFLNEKKIKLRNKIFQDWEYTQDSKGKVSLKSLNVDLELK